MEERQRPERQRPERQFRGQTTSIANEIRRNLEGYTDAQILHELIQNVNALGGGD